MISGKEPSDKVMEQSYLDPDCRSVTSTNVKWLQFSLRSLFILLSVAAVALGISSMLALLSLVIVVIVLCLYRGYWTSATGIAALLALLTLAGVGTRIEIKLDCGDVKTSVWGIPFVYSFVDEGAHQRLRGYCRSSANDEWMLLCYGWDYNGRRKVVGDCYRRVAAWEAVSEPTTSAIIDDLRAYIRDGDRGLPACTPILFWPVVVRDGEGFRLSSEWRNLSEVREYWMQKGIRAP